MTVPRGRRIRVLHVIQNLNYGGMEKVLGDLVRSLDQDRFEPHVLALEYFGRFARELAGRAPLHLGPPMSRFSLLRPKALTRCIAGLAPDIVHTHSGVWYKAARAARLAGVPWIVHTEHGRQAETWLTGLLSRRAARLSDAVVAVSSPLRVYLNGRLGLPPDRIACIPNGVDTEAFRPRQPSGLLRRELGLAADQAVVGSIGRLEPVKGYDVVIKAFEPVARAAVGSPPVLVIAGDGSTRGSLEALINSLGLRDRVFLLGWREDATELYAHFRCFVLGSWSEGTSVSLLEAMSCGVAPVVTAVGGNGDVLGPDLSGQLVRAGDVSGLADCLTRTLEAVAAARIGGLARRRVETAFGLGAMTGQYEDLYLNGPPRLRSDPAAREGGLPRRAPTLYGPGA